MEEKLQKSLKLNIPINIIINCFLVQEDARPAFLLDQKLNKDSADELKKIFDNLNFIFVGTMPEPHSIEFYHVTKLKEVPKFWNDKEKFWYNQVEHGKLLGYPYAEDLKLIQDKVRACNCDFSEIRKIECYSIGCFVRIDNNKEHSYSLFNMICNDFQKDDMRKKLLDTISHAILIIKNLNKYMKDEIILHYKCYKTKYLALTPDTDILIEYHDTKIEKKTERSIIV
jgi:hypothetical protein